MTRVEVESFGTGESGAAEIDAGAKEQPYEVLSDNDCFHRSWPGGLASSYCHDVEIWRDGQWQSLGSSQSAEILRQRNDGNLQFAMAMEGTIYHFNLEHWWQMLPRVQTPHSGLQWFEVFAGSCRRKYLQVTFFF